MFYITKEALIDIHIHQPPLSLPPPFFSSFPSPILSKHTYTHTHTFIRTSHIHTLSSLNTHTDIHTHRDQPAAICSTRSVQSSQNTLFTTIHHITFPQCHSLVLEKSEREQRREESKTAIVQWREREKQRERRFGRLHDTVVEKIRDSLIWLWGETRLSVKLVLIPATRLD